MAFRNVLDENLLGTGETHALVKFITERQDADLMPDFQLAGLAYCSTLEIPPKTRNKPNADAGDIPISL